MKLFTFIAEPTTLAIALGSFLLVLQLLRAVIG